MILQEIDLTLVNRRGLNRSSKRLVSMILRATIMVPVMACLQSQAEVEVVAVLWDLLDHQDRYKLEILEIVPIYSWWRKTLVGVP